jgi:hypothetical protein
VLTHTSEAFDSLDPSPYERASLTLANCVSESPLEGNSAAEIIGDEHKLSRKHAEEFLTQSEDIGFVDAESIERDRKLYFNGNLFRKNEAKKIQAVLGSLKEVDIAKITELDEKLAKSGAVPLGKAKQILTDVLFDKVHSIGMYDVSAVENETELMAYVTKPAAFHKFADPFCDDALHLAKALVASLTYGMTRSNPMRGRITMLPALLRKLIKGSYVGPADAIGQDYKILEMKRVVEIRPEGTSFFMKLLKKDVGEIALQVLTEGIATDATLSALQSASVTRFRTPDHTRSMSRRKQTVPSKKASTELLMALRTGQA